MIRTDFYSMTDSWDHTPETRAKATELGLTIIEATDPYFIGRNFGVKGEAALLDQLCDYRFKLISGVKTK